MKVKRRVLYGGIVAVWIAIPAFEITMAAASTDIVDEVCAPDTVHGSKRVEQTVHVIGIFMTYLLPLTLMLFFYSRLVIALRPKVT